MDRDTRIERMIEDMPRTQGIDHIQEPVAEAGEKDMMPLFAAYLEALRDRDNAGDFFDAFKALVTEHWTPLATERAISAEMDEEAEERYRRVAALI